VPVLDQVRARAQALNLSLADLDEMCGGYSYWEKSLRGIVWKKIQRAVKFLDGHLVVHFDPLE
jgi:hypothetical protein